MTYQTDQVSLLERALDQMAGVIAAIEPSRHAPAYDWLAGWFGRDPGWSPPT